MKKIKNIDSVSHNWGGVAIAAGVTYTCADQAEANYFTKDDGFIADLSSSKAEVYNDSTLVVGVASSLDFLRGSMTDADGALLVRTRAFSNADGFRFRGHSFSFTAAANAVTTYDYNFVAERHINGGRILLSSIGDNDKVSFQVVDTAYTYAGILYPADYNGIAWSVAAPTGVILDEFIKDYFIPTTGNLEVRLDYPARILQGLKLRMVYTNSQLLTAASIKCNLYLHMKT